MDILGIGAWELFFIVLIALIILGPKDMVKAGRSIGKFLRKTIFSPEWLNIQRSVRNLPKKLMEEADLDDINLQDLKDIKIDLENPEGSASISARSAASQGKKPTTIAEEWVAPPKPAPPTIEPEASPASQEPPPTQNSAEHTGSN